MPQRSVQSSDPFSSERAEADALKREMTELGERLLGRAEEVVEAITARALRRRAQEGATALDRSVEESFTRLGLLSTAAVGRWLAGEPVDVASAVGEEFSRVFAQMAASNEVPLGEVVRRCRYWRDGCQLLLRESAELGLAGEDALAGACEAIQRAADRTVAQMSAIFDGERTRVKEELARRQRELSFLATHDPLTGLANRALLLGSLEGRLALAERESREVAVLFIDLDDFKLVNDALGHSAGDRLLIGVAAALRGVTRKADTLGRFGGDEFVVVADGPWPDGGPRAIADRLLSAFAEPFVVEGRARRLRITASVGLAVWTATSPVSAEHLLSNADTAMYCAKARGGGCELFEPEMQERLRGELARRWAGAVAAAGLR